MLPNDMWCPTMFSLSCARVQVFPVSLTYLLFMTQEHPWLPFNTRIEFKVLFLVRKSQLLMVRHSGITSLLLFAWLFSLLPFPRLSLALSLAFFLERKCTESASVSLTP